MKHEELVQRVARIIEKSLREVKDPELRGLLLAEKIVTTVFKPAWEAREQALVSLYSSRPVDPKH